MNIAIIPARGGSKRIPRKNIREFCGKPIISYSIDAAKKSGLFEHVVVSTDDPEIAEVAKACGAEVPFTRPTELSDDYAATVPVVAHAIRTTRELGWVFDSVCCIYPCAPLVQVEDVCGALLSLNNSIADYCFPVTEYPSSIHRALRLLNGGKTQPIFPDFQLQRTQDGEPAYFDVGQFYWGSVEAWLSKPNIHNSGVGYVIPNWRVVDIDNVADWQRAEIFFNIISGNVSYTHGKN